MFNGALFTIAKGSAADLIHQKWVWACIALGTVILLSGIFLGDISINEQQRLIFHTGVFSIATTSLLFSIAAGGTRIPREIERETASMDLARPITRRVFCLGHWLGLVIILLLLIFALGSLLFFLLWLNLQNSEVQWWDRFLLCLFAIATEGVLLLSFSMALSIKVRPAIAMASAVVLYMASHWQSDLIFYAKRHPDSPLTLIGGVLKWILPPLESLNFKNYYFVFERAGTEDLVRSTVLAFLICFLWTILYIRFLLRLVRRKDFG